MILLARLVLLYFSTQHWIFCYGRIIHTIVVVIKHVEVVGLQRKLGMPTELKEMLIQLPVSFNYINVVSAEKSVRELLHGTATVEDVIKVVNTGL